jgi:alpha-beta hydrolase superfamily lysophospholipase
LWFGAVGRPAFGWLHVPGDFASRAGVVICPPLGLDYMEAHYALRALAEQLASRGMCALRLDYDGTGDSAGGEADPDRVSSWLGTISSAVGLLRVAGVEPLSLVGMRAGAALAAAAAARDGGIDQLVLWGPCSGEHFIREQHALLRLAFGVSGPSAGPVPIAIPGTCLSAQAVAELGQLRPGRLPLPLARRALLLVEPGRPVERCFEEASFGLELTSVEAAPGHEKLVGAPTAERELPAAAISAVAGWLADGAPERVRAFGLPEGTSGRAIVQVGRWGRVAEEPVSIPPLGLFGVLSTPEQPRGAPAVIFLSTAMQHHVGPARLWVQLSRRLAAEGFTTLRLDHSGLGDSPSRPGEGRRVCNKPSAFDDVAEAAEHISPGDPSNVVLIGLCSGGYQALESALALGAKGVVAINPGISFVPPERREGFPVDPRRRVALSKDEVPGIFREGGRLGRLRQRYPALAWTVRLLAFSRNKPAKWLSELRRQGTKALLVCGDEEMRLIAAGATKALLKRLSHDGVVVGHWAGLEHQLLDVAQREAVLEVVTDFLVSNFGEAGRAAPSTA